MVAVSPYSWFGFTNIIKFRPLLQAHGIEVEILPFFLGAAREGAGNPFAPTPQWKQAFAAQDTELTGELLGLKVVAPDVFPISSLFVSGCLAPRKMNEMADDRQPVRIATWVKEHYASDKFDATFEAFASGYWSKKIDVSKPEGIHKALDTVFGAQEVDEIMKKALSPGNKKRVIEITKGAGAFGAPWIVGVDGKGEKRSWFGNDRWNQVFYHLGVPFESLRVLPPGNGQAKL